MKPTFHTARLATALLLAAPTQVDLMRGLIESFLKGETPKSVFIDSSAR